MFNISENKKYKFPYPHTYLEKSVSNYSQLEQTFPNLNNFSKSIRMTYDLTFPDKNYIKLINHHYAWMKLHKYIYSEKFFSDFLNIYKSEIESLYKKNLLIYNPFDLKIHSNPFETNKILSFDEYKGEPFLYSRLDIGVGGLDYGKNNGGGGIHVDNYGRILSMLLYFDPTDEMIGGEHCLYKIQNKKAVLSKIITPKPNLLVTSLQTNTSLHSVNPVVFINKSNKKHLRRALYFSISCSRKIWTDPEIWIARLGKSRVKNNLINRLKNKVARLF